MFQWPMLPRSSGRKARRTRPPSGTACRLAGQGRPSPVPALNGTLRPAWGCLPAASSARTHMHKLVYGSLEQHPPGRMNSEPQPTDSGKIRLLSSRSASFVRTRFAHQPRHEGVGGEAMGRWKQEVGNCVGCNLCKWRLLAWQDKSMVLDRLCGVGYMPEARKCGPADNVLPSPTPATLHRPSGQRIVWESQSTLHTQVTVQKKTRWAYYPQN